MVNTLLPGSWNLLMKVGDLVKARRHKHAPGLPKSYGIITEELGAMVYVLWPDCGTHRGVSTMFLKVISESR
jgi:hypothetical protein